MKLLLRLFGRSETPVLLFGIGLFLFTWPFLNETASNSLEQLYGFLFTSWLMLIAGVALVARSAKQQDNQDRE